MGPKKIGNAVEHGGFGHIMITSLRIRLTEGLQKKNGVAKNIDPRTELLRKHNRKAKSFAISLVEFKKAFDSVSHEAIA